MKETSGIDHASQFPVEATDLQIDEQWHLEKLFAKNGGPSVNGNPDRPVKGTGWDDLKRKGYNTGNARVILKIGDQL